MPAVANPGGLADADLFKKLCKEPQAFLILGHLSTWHSGTPVQSFWLIPPIPALSAPYCLPLLINLQPLGVLQFQECPPYFLSLSTM